MTWILVTNDDGADTPSLAPLARAMERLAPVRVVVPHIERSWVGKAITRFDPIVVEQTERDGYPIRTATGFPADCVQLGVHALFDTPPALVVSGINLGMNHGSAYLQSSGTVGACLEGSIAGVPGVALSTGSLDRPWSEWRSWALTADSASMWERLASAAVPIADAMLRTAPPGQVISVNLPDKADETTPLMRTEVAHVGYDRLFQEHEPGVFVHRFGGTLFGDGSLDGTDVGAARSGAISVTPVQGATSAAMSPDTAAALGLA